MTNWHSRQHLELLIAVQSTQLPELLTRQQFSATAHGLNSGKRNSPLARDAQFDQTGLTLGTQHLRCKSVLENEMHLGVTLASDSRISTRSACTGLHFRFMHLGGGGALALLHYRQRVFQWEGSWRLTWQVVTATALRTTTPTTPEIFYPWRK